MKYSLIHFLLSFGLPFKDLTNNEQSYGCGRYLDFKQGDILPNNTLELDFNRCYNPLGAFSHVISIILLQKRKNWQKKHSFLPAAENPLQALRNPLI